MKVKVMVKVTPCHACAGTEERHRYSSNPFAIDARMGWMVSNMS